MFFPIPSWQSHPFSSLSQDNHDAEAFLKPVSRIDYPDYYESKLPTSAHLSPHRGSHSECESNPVIKEPMDFQTMLRKVKQKQYKSKNEFIDDLELIWSNCSIYNTGDVRLILSFSPSLDPNPFPSARMPPREARNPNHGRSLTSLHIFQ